MKNLSKKKIMTSNNFKTFLFAGLIAAMVLPFSMINYADAKSTDQEIKYEISDVVNTLQDITPYVSMDADDMVTFDVAKNQIPLSDKTINIATDYFKMQNNMNVKARDNPDQKYVADPESKQKFSKFAEKVQEEGKKSQKVTKILGTDWFLPEVFAAWGDVCGQSPWNPLPEPSANLNIIQGQTSHNYLIGEGYHMVPFYAALTFDRDHAKEVNYLECTRGEMRMQAYINTPGNPYTSNEYHSQGPEPNPEILEYSAPSIWWDGYTLIWHGLF